MNESDRKNLLKHRIDKSKETIEDARIAIENGRYRNAMNRIYYAIFYIVSALAVKEGFSTSKHKQLLGWFNFNFVKEGKISVDLWDIYKIAYDNRQESDYEDYIEYKADDVIRYYNDMLRFVSEIEKIINS
jgi:uncharacterized protein (UPF0332 family)